MRELRADMFLIGYHIFFPTLLDECLRNSLQCVELTIVMASHKIHLAETPYRKAFYDPVLLNRWCLPVALIEEASEVDSPVKNSLSYCYSIV